jgi:hypothetical protein
VISRRAGWLTFPYTASVGKLDLATVCTLSTVKSADAPSCSRARMCSPFFRRLRCMKTPSPY